jgi:hypothetical protein
MRDLDNVRTFLGGPGPVALFDLPWMPVHLSICFAFHFLVGITALIGGFILIMLTLLREWLAHNPTRLGTAHTQLLESSRRNTEALVAMGMVGNMIRRWRAVNADYIVTNRRAQAMSMAGWRGLESAQAPSGGLRWHHHRRLDLDCTRAGACRCCHRPLARRVDIRAPQNGTVFQLGVHTIGGAIQPGETVMLIVPDADSLTIEAK